MNLRRKKKTTGFRTAFESRENGLYGQEEEHEEVEEAREGTARTPAEQMRVHRHTLFLQDLVPSVHGWKSTEFATPSTRSG